MCSSAAATFSCQTRPWLCSRLLPSRFAGFLMALCEQITVFSSDQTATFFWWGVFLSPPPPFTVVCELQGGLADSRGSIRSDETLMIPLGDRAHTLHTHTLTVHIKDRLVLNKVMSLREGCMQTGSWQSQYKEGLIHPSCRLEDLYMCVEQWGDSYCDKIKWLQTIRENNNDMVFCSGCARGIKRCFWVWCHCDAAAKITTATWCLQNAW